MTALLSRFFVIRDLLSTSVCEGIVLPNGKVVLYWYTPQIIMVIDSMSILHLAVKDMCYEYTLEWGND